MIPLAVLNANAQQVDPLQQLQQQLEQLKQQYADTAKVFEQRIAALEEQLEKQKEASAKLTEGTVSVAELAEEAAKKVLLGQSGKVGPTYQGQLSEEPTYDNLQEADQKITGLEQGAAAFEFHGYFRSGYGLNSVGGQQVAFQAPGAGAKFRLGNEAETYGEFIFVNNWVNPNHATDKAWFKTEVMLEADTTNSSTYAGFTGGVGNDTFRLREAFIQAGNLFESQPDAKFWAGERYYRRQHIEIDDFYPLDMSGYGAGVEDLNVGVGKLAVSYLAGARPDILTQYGAYAKSNIDVRLYGLKGPAGLWAGWFNYAISKGGEQTSTGAIIPTANGYAFGLRHQKLSGTTMVITRWRSSTEPERPATSVRRLTIPRGLSVAPQGFWRRNRCFSNSTTGSPLCQSQSTSASKTAIRLTGGRHGCRWARGQKSFSRNTSRWRLREAPITRTLGASTTAGCASSRSRRKSEQVDSSKAVQCFASS